MVTPDLPEDVDGYLFYIDDLYCFLVLSVDFINVLLERLHSVFPESVRDVVGLLYHYLIISCAIYEPKYIKSGGYQSGGSDGTVEEKNPQQRKETLSSYSKVNWP